MFKYKLWLQYGPVAFAAFLCIAMCAGEVYSNQTNNPFAVAYYSFLPVALWMMVNQQRSYCEAIRELRARMEQLEGKPQASNPKK
jgi:hypothetical protein